MQRRAIKSTRSGEKGVVILLVAIVMLFVVAAIAALAIDLVTFYTARSEAQQAADGAALAGARALANSGMTSANPLDNSLISNAEIQASAIATQVGAQNNVGGGAPTVTPTIDTTNPLNPRVTVVVTKNNLPTYFSRIWGNTAASVKATATAEAYNPSGTNSSPGVAPACVKPWILPNKDPVNLGNPIFDPATGALQDYGLLGWNAPKSPGSPTGLTSACPAGNCSGSTLPPAVAWEYYPRDPSDFQPPAQVRTCAAVPAPSPYQKGIASCVPEPVTCNQVVRIDTANVPGRAKDTADAVNCLTHAAAALGDGDVVDPTFPTTPPFSFQGGNQNPIASVRGQQVVVSDSLVTVPVVDTTLTTSSNPVAPVVGFVQIFVNADGGPTSNVDPAPIQTKIVNMVGCGNNASPPGPILGNGSSPVAVRLIAPGP